MRQVILVALLCLFLLVQGHAGCDHDAERERTRLIEERQGFKFDRLVSDHGRSKLRKEQQSVWANMRVQIYTDYILNDVETRSCYTLGNTYNTFCGGSACTGTCTSNYLINSTLIATTVNTLLPEIQSILSQLLQVKPVVQITYSSGAKCNNGMGGIPIPPSIVASGQTNDLLLIFTARPSINVGTIATAAYCFRDTTTGRPYSAHINLDPDYFFRRQSYSDNRGTLLHEVTHALGFSADHWAFYINPDTNAKLGSSNVIASATSTYTDSTGTLQSKSVNYMKTPKVLAAQNAYFGCNSLPTSAIPGVALEEGGGSGTAGSHWDKRILYGEYMVGSTTSLAGVTYAISPFTLGLLEDSGWYKPNAAYAATIPGSVPMIWGKNTGCTMPTQRCEDWSSLGSMSSSYFCSVNKYAIDSSTQCTFNLRAKGLCNMATYSSNLGYYEHIRSSPTLGGTDQLMDYCPYVYSFSNGDCRNPANSGIGKSYESFSATSSCWDSNLSLTSETLKTSDSRCFQYVCSTTSTVLSVKISSTTIACPADQSGVTITSGLPAGYKGYIVCPTNGFDTLCPPIGTSTPTPAPTGTTKAPTTSAPGTTASPGTTKAPTTSAPGATTKSPTTSAPGSTTTMSPGPAPGPAPGPGPAPVPGSTQAPTSTSTQTPSTIAPSPLLSSASLASSTFLLIVFIIFY